MELEVGAWGEQRGAQCRSLAESGGETEALLGIRWSLMLAFM